MTEPIETSTASSSDSNADGNVTVLHVSGKTVHLVGTAHISARSAEEVREVIAQVQPDTVCVELDEMRLKALTRSEAWRDMDLFKVVRSGQSTMLLAHLILSSFQRKLGDQLGVKPGAEMLAAVEAAQTAGAELVMADRDIQVTLRRTWGQLKLWDKVKLLSELLSTLVLSPEIGEEEIEALKERDMLGQVMETFAKAFPRAKTVLIDERDAYLAQKIREAPGTTLVAVVGAGHVAGMVQHLAEGAPETDLAPLMTLPKRGWVLRGLQWGIPLLVLGLLAYGFTTADAEVSWGMVKVWVLANGILSALGALLALAHPVTIGVAFLAAPITSLNPMVAAGWVAGLCELLLRKPRVRDFESLPTDITSLRGFWHNGITRVLLVVALANVGSSIGTFIGIPLMTRLLG